MQSVCEAAGGEAGLVRLAEAWRKGDGRGDRQYSERYGDETAVVRMHSGNGLHEEMDWRAIACFDQALEDVGLTEDPLHQVLHDYFAWATTTNLAARHGVGRRRPAGPVHPTLVVGRPPACLNAARLLPGAWRPLMRD